MDVKQTLIDAQAAVIGSVLISPEIVGDVMLRVSADDFLTPQYRHVFDAVHEQWAACQAVDVVTVLHRLGDAYRPLLVQIMADTPTAANWEAYADVMREQARLARIKDAAAKMLDAATLDEARAAVETASECLCDSKTLRVVSWYQGLLPAPCRWASAGLSPLGHPAAGREALRRARRSDHYRRPAEQRQDAAGDAVCDAHGPVGPARRRF